MRAKPEGLVARMMDVLDLVIDFATLGEYGLESAPADGPGEGTGRETGWEALSPARRGSP